MNRVVVAPLLFTPELMAEAQAKGRAYTGRFIERLALWPSERGVVMRAQIERCAARIPPEKRARVLSPILAASDQAPAALNQLLLATVLEDQGWEVEHEPGLAGLTPDFRIRKASAEFLVEVVKCSEKDPDAPQVARIREAFAGMKTLRPISVISASVDGSASLKTLVADVMRFNSTGTMRRRKRFEDRGVSVVYELHPGFTEPVPVILGWGGGRARFGGPTEAIQERVADKVKKYKMPLIVAVDLTGVAVPTVFADEAMYGNRTFNFRINRERGVTDEVPTGGRASNGLFMQPGRRQQRMRDRLIAILPFDVSATMEDAQWGVMPSLLTNPYFPIATDFSRFSPMPRYVSTGISDGHYKMKWFGEQQSEWPAGPEKGRRFVPASECDLSP